MIVRRFLLWARTATPGQRAEALAALARSYLYSELSREDRWEAETALTAMLDDPSPLVRRALAETFANAPEAPRHLVVALASDQSDIAALVLARSPLLTDADLVDAAALGDDVAQTAIARRPQLSPAVCGALAEIGGADAVTVLLDNGGARISDSSLARILARHGGNAQVREAMLQRPGISVEIRQSIAVALADSLKVFVIGCGWLGAERGERVTREAREKTTVSLSIAAPTEDVRRLVAHLRRSGQLTPALILRAILSRGLGFAEAAFAELTNLPLARVSALLHDRRGAGFGPLFVKAGLPASLKPAFEAALSALRETQADTPAEGAQLSRRMIERVLSACAHLPPEEAGKLLTLLRRYEVEAAREEAREIANALADDAALEAVLAFIPDAIADSLRLERRRAA